MANVIEAFPNGSDGTASFPEGGTTGQVLAKHSNADNDVEWKTIDVEKDVTPTENSTNAVQSGGVYTALADKVDKVQGKGLSTEDYTTTEKNKLSGIATDAEKNTIVGITVNGDAITPDANRIAALTVITNTVNNLLNYYNKTETYTKTEVDTLVSAVAGATFESVQTLPTTNIKTNVIYLVPKQTPETSNIKDEYINLDGTTAGWELIGDTGVDLSNYVTTTALNTALGNYTTTADLTTLLAGKVDKVSGKQLSTEDYTTAEKTKLSGLSNYDDTALSGRVSSIEGVVPSTATSSNKLATMSDVTSAGAHIVEDSTGVDMTARKNLQFVGATVTDDSTNNRTVVTVDMSGKADKVASAVSGNFAALDANGNLTDSGKKASDFGTASDVSAKEDKFRLTTMPTASATNVNKIVQYIGASIIDSYQNGYYYKCVLDDGSYKWVESATMDISGSTKDARIDDDITKIKAVYDDTRTDFRVIPVISVNLADTITKSKTPDASDIVYAKSLYDAGRITKAELDEVVNLIDKSFATASLDTIKAISDLYYDGIYSLTDINEWWSIGDTRTVPISAMEATGVSETHSAQNVTMRIVDFEHDDLTTSINEKTKALFTFGFLLSEGGGMNTSNTTVGGWSSCARRTWCNEVCLNAFPQGFVDIIKSVEKQNGNGSGNTSTVITTSDKIFIPNVAEFLSAGFSPGESGKTFNVDSCGTSARYEYYKTASNLFTGFPFWTATSAPYLNGYNEMVKTNWLHITKNASTVGGKYYNTPTTVLRLYIHGCI